MMKRRLQPVTEVLFDVLSLRNTTHVLVLQTSSRTEGLYDVFTANPRSNSD